MYHYIYRSYCVKTSVKAVLWDHVSLSLESYFFICPFLLQLSLLSFFRFHFVLLFFFFPFFLFI